ncbi:hypothetical protein CVT24_002982 [Panaeolus cyanescens]|uniref:F-box domain-containing protein n=1 Tax=Panaeolus cyanescens TaxID=181874 RepID=A0A409VU02_9AGAR|nr:hypothetical protein CVT24_002982 [Panaeolus cyanescens]
MEPNDNTRSSPIFPVEIFQEILAHIGPDNKRDLIPIGLVSSSFAALRRPHLFYTITVDITAFSFTSSHQRLMELLRSNRSLSSHVRHLVCEMSPRAIMASAASQQELLVFIYLHFRNIDELSIFAHPSAHTRTFAVVHSLLDHFLSVRRLTRLSLQNMQRIPILDILSQPRLNHLNIVACVLKRWDKGIQTHKIQQLGSRVKTLTWVYGTNHSIPLALLYCQQLEELVIDHTPVLGMADMTGMGVAPGLDPSDLERLPAHLRPSSTFQMLHILVCPIATNWTPFCYLAEKEGVKAFPSLTTLKMHQGYNLFELLQENPPSALFDHVVKLEKLYIIKVKRRKIQGGWEDNTIFRHLHSCFVNSQTSLKTIFIHWKLSQYTPEIVLGLYRALEGIKRNNILESLVLNVYLAEPSLSLLSPDLQE